MIIVEYVEDARKANEIVELMQANGSEANLEPMCGVYRVEYELGGGKHDSNQ